MYSALIPQSTWAAAMVKVLERALDEVARLRAAPGTALERLKAVARWTMQVQLAGQMPSLPAQNSSLRAALVAHKVYMDRLLRLSDELGEWIVQAQADGALRAGLPPEIVLYTLFARACDPVLGLLKLGGQYSDEQIVELLLSTCFDGLAGAP
eukprot:Opistho-1_new@103329